MKFNPLKKIKKKKMTLKFVKPIYYLPSKFTKEKLKISKKVQLHNFFQWEK